VIYELRIYQVSPGKMPALLQRFEKFTLEIWKKHGIRQGGFWTTMIGESSQQLTYMLAWESLAERDQKWTAFAADPQWLAVRAETERDGPLVDSFSNQILKPTAFSAVK
jgi:NIPSNAP